MNIIIVDDDQEFIKKLETDIEQQFSNIDELHIFTFHNNFHKIFTYSHIDIVFLDIDLKFSDNGINLAKHLKRIYPKIIIIFVSSHDDFVFNALSIGFFQFIRKKKYTTDVPKVLLQTKNYYKENNYKIVLNINGRQKMINLNEVQYILSIGHDLFIKTINEDFTIYSSLGKFIENTEYPDIMQIQKNLAINFNYAKSVCRNEIIMNNNEKFIVGRKYQSKVLDAHKEFLLK